MKKASTLIISNIICISCLLAQDTTTYLATNYCPIIENKYDTNIFSLLKEDILTRQIFTFGEAHDHKGNSNIYKDLFVALNLRGVKHIVFELPCGWNYLINNYLNTGDSIAYNDLQRVMTIAPDWMQFFEWVYKYNTHLPFNTRITIDFIDIEGENNYNPSIRSLQMLLKKNESPPIVIAPIVNKINRFKQPNHINKKRKLCKKRYKRLAKKLYVSVNNNDALYREYLKENYDELKKLSEGYYLANYYSWITLFNFVSIGSSKMTYNREQFMYKRYVDLIAKYNNEKIFSVHGKMHLNMPDDTINFTVIKMLNTYIESPVRGKVCSIGIDSPSDNFGNFLSKKSMPLFLQYCKTPLTLFKLNGENTPFKELSQTIQYLIINKY